MIDEVMRGEIAEAQIDTFIDRQAAKSKEARAGQHSANMEEDRQRARDTRRTHAVRLVNARAWAEYFGGLALASHDQAARYAERRDEALALVRKLESTYREERKSA